MNLGKSLFKGFKYAGLHLGAAAVAAIATPDVVSSAVGGAVLAAGAPMFVAVIVGQYGVPVVVSALAGVAEQLRKHRG